MDELKKWLDEQIKKTGELSDWWAQSKHQEDRDWAKFNAGMHDAFVLTVAFISSMTPSSNQDRTDQGIPEETGE